MVRPALRFDTVAADRRRPPGRRRPRPRRRVPRGGVGRTGLPPARHLQRPNRGHPGARSLGDTGRLDGPDGDGRSHPAFRQRHLPRRPGPRGGGGGDRRRGPRRCPPSVRTADRPAQRGVGRRHAGGLRHDRRMGVRPLFVRATAGLLPGPQAPVRRHVHVAPVESCHERCLVRRRGCGRSRCGRAGQRGQGLHRPVRGRVGPGLHADARGHRRDVRAQSASVPAARDGESSARRHAGGPPSTDRRCRRRTGRDGGVSALQVETAEEMESLEDFRQRARSFIRANLRLVSPEELRYERNSNDDEAELATVARDREIQRMLFDAGLAGICFPRAYGGQGLTHEHQNVLNEEFAGYEYPLRVQIPTLSPCAAVILEFGTEQQKLSHLPAILRGEELWMQFLSEPSGGSDVAGALTTAVRDGEQWILNGSKVWTSGAWWSDWGLCLARTNWDQPKHRGLTVFMLPIHQSNVEVHRIEMNNGSREFCQEFMTDVIIPDTDRVGAVDEGWTVGTRWMFHERMLYNSSFVTEPVGLSHGSQDAKIVFDIARSHGTLDDALVRDGIGEARMLELVVTQLADRVAEGVRSGHMSDQAAGLVRLFKGTSVSRVVTLALNTAGASGAAWAEGDTAAMSAINFLMRQAGSIRGGATAEGRTLP